MIAFLGLGSNLGDLEENLSEALDRLARNDQVQLKDISSLYLTEPVGFRDQSWFLNCVISAEVAMTASGIITFGKSIESSMHREPTVPMGPRIIDVDLLMFGSQIVQTAGCTVPHPRMLERRFVLIPLLEIAPSLSHPSGLSIQEALSALRGGEKVILVKKNWYLLKPNRSLFLDNPKET